MSRANGSTASNGTRELLGEILNNILDRVVVIGSDSVTRHGVAEVIRRTLDEMPAKVDVTVARAVLPGAVPSETDVLVVSSLGDRERALLRTLAGELPTVAILNEWGPAQVQTLIELGAHCAVTVNEVTLHVPSVLIAAAEGYAYVPRPCECLRAQSPLCDEITWLEMMARGDSMHRVQECSGLSTRQVRRRLRNLYSHLGVASRLEAVAKAAACGLISVTRVGTTDGMASPS